MCAFIYSNGYVCPETYNPADFLIGVLANAPGCEKASQRSAHRLCDLFAVSSVSQQRDMLVNLEMHMLESGEVIRIEKKNISKIKLLWFQIKFKEHEESNGFLKPLWPVVLFWLCYRLLLTVLRDPTIQTLRIIQKLV